MLAVISPARQGESETMLEGQCARALPRLQRDGKYKGRAPTVRHGQAEIAGLKASGVTPTEIASQYRERVGAPVYRVLAEGIHSQR